MKIFFLKDHSLYKIFTTLEKVPEGKTIQVFIDPEHSFFENERRGKQIKEVLEKRKINAYFITKTDRHKHFFQKIWLKIIHQEKNKILKSLNLFYMFFFNIKKFHLHVYNTKNFIFYIVFFFETAFILWIIYLLYTLILPSTTLKIIPSNHIESVIYNFRYYPNNDINYPNDSRFLSIPFHTGFMDYKYEITISSSHLKHIQNPSQWQIKITNTTSEEISLIPNTRFITDDWRLFQTLSRTKLPPAYEDIPGETIITIKAMERDINDVLMWSRWNIPKDTKLYIKNLDSSFFLKEIFAQSIENFTGWSLQTEWQITQKDINILSGELNKYVHQRKKYIVAENFKLENSVLLPFNDLISTKVQNIEINHQVGEKVPNLWWTIITRYNFYYVKIDDIKKAVQAYLDQRPSEKVQLITIDTNSLNFFSDIKRDENIIILPTKIDIIQWYDFSKDINGVIETIKTEILSKNSKDAKNLILAHPEISTVKLKINPLRYNSIPRIKSRIKIEIENP